MKKTVKKVMDAKSPEPARMLPSRAETWTARTGAVKMEYVLIVLLIATVCTMAVVIFSRGVMSGWFAATDATLLQSDKALTELKMRRADRNEDMKAARSYQEYMSNVDE